MSTPVIAWTVIIGLFVAALVIRLTVEAVRHLHEHHSHGIFSLGTECEEVFVPGDPGDDDEKELLYDED